MSTLTCELELFETVASAIHSPTRKRGGDELPLESFIARAVPSVDCPRVCATGSTELAPQSWAKTVSFSLFVHGSYDGEGGTPLSVVGPLQFSCPCTHPLSTT